MEQSLTASSAGEEVDWTKYEPPEALTKVPNITSETIMAVVVASLDNIRQQIKAEEEQAARREEAAARDAEANIASKGKDKGKAGEEQAWSEIMASIPGPDPGPPPGPAGAGPSKPHGRSRLGISRILRHVVGGNKPREEKSTTSTGHNQAPPGNDMPSPTGFTKFVYKHIKPASQESVEGPVECVSCLEDIPPKDRVKTVCHYYCKECFERLLRTAIENEAQWPPKCCLNPIPFRTINKYIRGGLLGDYKKKAEEFGTPVESRIYCSQPDCGEWIRKEHINRAAKTARCRRGHSLCTICRQAAHPSNANCPQDHDQRLADRLAEEEGWRRCHKCSVLVEHREACQHMTCRCGAQFCYVCGAPWCTCSCNMEALEAHKSAARARREARTAEEDAEARELREALRLVEEFEAEQAAADEDHRRREDRAREDRRRRAAEERARTEEARRVALDRRYADLGRTLADLEDLHRASVAQAHSAESQADARRAAHARAALAAEHDAERVARRAAVAAAVADCEMEWDRYYCAGVAWELRLEKDYEAALEQFWADKLGGPELVGPAMAAYKRKNDLRMDAWKQWRDSELEKFRYAQEDELAIRMELMGDAKKRQEETLSAHEAEVNRRQVAELKWVDLVMEERSFFCCEGTISPPKRPSTIAAFPPALTKMFGGLIYVACLLVNAIAILSEDRFLARINLSPSSYDPAFGQNADASAKAKVINLIASVRTLMRTYELVLG
ncbi:hypothetical protein QBC33DRAFT_512647 [Phialemonium atrogriseum]|uniref:RBR-type E3 ubiquitin transferase n=1 Tax=Phialemonium atrogriseum TaxID=1093897 RepID=A0AAJ0FP77_9PEZI|nr:uncharacterized protein QBC33DRAFT_512647 [Phialemonium atrogriseum]KAK1769978.1 hypothetical protein QBC33DRAFT_512647 [Phialemonium atrogriseum]